MRFQEVREESGLGARRTGDLARQIEAGWHDVADVVERLRAAGLAEGDVRRFVCQRADQRWKLLRGRATPVSDLPALLERGRSERESLLREAFGEGWEEAWKEYQLATSETWIRMDPEGLFGQEEERRIRDLLVRTARLSKAGELQLDLKEALTQIDAELGPGRSDEYLLRTKNWQATEPALAAGIQLEELKAWLRQIERDAAQRTPLEERKRHTMALFGEARYRAWMRMRDPFYHRLVYAQGQAGLRAAPEAVYDRFNAWRGKVQAAGSHEEASRIVAEAEEDLGRIAGAKLRWPFEELPPD